MEYVFILGAGRSGTKFLRGLLEASEEVVAIPYDVGYIWRYGNESFINDELTTSMLNAKIIKYIRSSLPNLVRCSKKSAHVLIEKSVPNTLRPEFIFKVYPDAKFIHLIRDGRAVTESSIRMWSEPVDHGYLLGKIKYFSWSNYKYAFWYLTNMMKRRVFSDKGGFIWGPRYEGIENDVFKHSLETVCARQWKRSVEVSLEQLDVIPKEQVMEVRYEALVAESVEIKKLCEFIGVKDVDRVVEKFNKTVTLSDKEKWRTALSADSLVKINQEIGSLLGRLGYE